MIDALKFSTDRASAADIFGHLSRCDSVFVPPLSSRVDINDYAQKIAGDAVRFEAWLGRELTGLVAAYCNEPGKACAFITSVSVLPEWQEHGIASQLVAHCVTYAQRKGFGRIELEVASCNRKAVALYEKHGFLVSRTDGLAAFMSLAIGEDA